MSIVVIFNDDHIDGLLGERRNSSALANSVTSILH